MKKIVLFIIGAFLFIFGYSFGIEQSTSGIGKIEYQVKWCNSIFGCKIGYFSSLSTTVGPNYNNGFIESSHFKTICTNCTNSNNIKNLFLNLKLKGEGVYTITIHTYDKVKYGAVKKCDGGYTSAYTDGNAPGNCSKLVLVYKIDKTHPNIVDPLNNNSSYPKIEESSKYVYVGKSDKSANIKDFDANINEGNNEKFIKGNINNLGNNASQSTKLRRNLKTIYYSNDNKNINIKFDIKNYFDTEPNYIGNIAPLDKVELLNETGSILSSGSLSNKNSYNNWSLNGSIKDIFGSNADRKVFYFKFYDKAGNYSEVPIYIVKDITSPITLNEFLNTFTFLGGEKIFYTTEKKGPYVDGNNSIPSKFFDANDNLRINFSLSDTKNGNTNEKNSGLLKIKFKLENASSCNNYSEYTLNPNDSGNQENGTTISQSWSINHNFSIVDNCFQDSNKTYRYYRAKVISIDNNGNEYQNKICDKVGNCTEIVPLVFRVVANKLDKDKSKFQVNIGNLVGGKMISNGKSFYTLYFNLKDRYGNKIVPVYSQEDNKEIKTSKLSLSFHNGMFLNQINKNNGYGIFKYDLETDTKNSINGILTGSFYTEENSQNSPNGVYKIKITSIVPTSDIYPWISSGAYLQLNSVNFLSKNIGGTNFTKDSDIGQYNINQFNGTNINKISLNNGNLSYNNDTINKFLKVDSINYGKLNNNTLFTENSFSNIAGNKIRFSFASPVLIGLYDIKNLSEGVKNIYKYNLWNIDSSIISGGNFSIEEKWMTNNPYNFTQGSGTNNITSKEIELIGHNFDNDINDLNIIGVFNNSKQISKFTKIFINPNLASFIDKNNNHMALGTKINYQINGLQVILPSDGKGVSDSKINSDIANPTFGDSISIFNPTNGFNSSNGSSYNDTELQPFIKNIKILGIASTNGNEKQTFSQDKNKNITIGGDIRKWKIKNNIKRKVSIITRGLKWNDSCNAGICNEYKYGNGEYIVPINGDLTFNHDYKITKKITYIVKGNVYIKGNLYKGNKNALLSIVVLNPNGFSKKSVTFNNNILSFSNNKGFVFIDPKVINIDAFIFAEGSLLSYNGNKIFDGANTFDTDIYMFNQLYIRGGIITSNTIGGSRLPNTSRNKCPWFLSFCNTNIAQAFDLIYLRRYMLTDASIYGGPDGKKVPYIPVSIANDIDSYNEKKPYMGGKRYCKIIGNSTVDCNKDANTELKNIPNNGIEYPLYIEFDTSIKSNTPEIFKP